MRINATLNAWCFLYQVVKGKPFRGSALFLAIGNQGEKKEWGNTQANLLGQKNWRFLVYCRWGEAVEE
jgi:hypothetical protein